MGTFSFHSHTKTNEGIEFHYRQRSPSNKSKSKWELEPCTLGKVVEIRYHGEEMKGKQLKNERREK